MRDRHRSKPYVACILFVAAVCVGTLLLQQETRADWEVEDEGLRYREDEDDYAVGFLELDGKRYYFDTDGYLVTGKFYVEDTQSYYYADQEGVIQTGSISTENAFYIADENGCLQTGFVDWEGDSYYFNDNAQLLTGWFKLRDDWYYADYKGVLQKGFVTVGGYRYYLLENGKRVSDSVMEIDGVVYIFNEDGSVDENATAFYPLSTWIDEYRTQQGLSSLIINSRVQACAILRADNLKNGFQYNNAQEELLQLLQTHGVESQGGQEFSYGGTKDFGMEELEAVLQKDSNFLSGLQDKDMTSIGMGYYEEDGIYYYDIILLKE